MAGRPPIPYDPRIGEEICERIVSSRMGLEWVLDTMRSEPEFAATPSLPTVYKWMEQNPKFLEDSARARTLSADTYVDAAIQEAHSSRLGVIETDSEKDGKSTKTADNVERSKLIVQTLLKRAGQLNPKKYGDRTIHAGDKDNPLTVDIDRESVIAKILGK